MALLLRTRWLRRHPLACLASQSGSCAEDMLDTIALCCCGQWLRRFLFYKVGAWLVLIIRGLLVASVLTLVLVEDNSDLVSYCRPVLVFDVVEDRLVTVVFNVSLLFLIMFTYFSSDSS